ncbi:MAG: Crp/Fnr family transcriptional regulator [Sulfitobacter sp.]
MIEIMILPAPFSKLNDRALTKQRLNTNELLFCQGDLTHAIFFILSGTVHLVRHTEEGHRVVLHKALAGTTFAEASLFSDVYHCDAVASEKTVVLRLSKTDILSMLSNDTAFSLALLKQLSDDVQTHRKHLELLAIRRAQDRVFAALLSFGQRGKVTAFASFIGLTNEATLRALSELVTQGKVTRVTRGQYKVRSTGP